MKVYLAGKVDKHHPAATPPLHSKWRVMEALSLLVQPQWEFVAIDDPATGLGEPKHSDSYKSDFICGITESSAWECEHVVEEAARILNSCDALVAYLHSPDSFGPVAEIAWMASRGKPCLVLLQGIGAGADAHDDAMADAYWFVSLLPGVKVRAVSTPDQAVGITSRFLAELQEKEHA